MSWEDELPPDDEEELEDQDEVEGDEDKEQDAKLAEAVQAALAKERENLKAEVRTELQGQFDQDKKTRDRRFNATLTSLREMGMEVDDEGKVRRPEAPKQEPKVETPTILFDAYDTPEEQTRKINALIAQQAEAIAEKREKSLRQEIAELRQAHTVTALTLSPPEKRAQEFLEETYPALVGDEEFGKQFRAALNEVPPGGLVDPDVIDTVAAVALARTRGAYRSQGKDLPKPKMETPDPKAQDAERRAAANRAGLQQTRSTNGTPPNPEVTEDERAVIAQFEEAGWGPMNVTKLRALAKDNTGGAYRRVLDREEKRRRAKV